MNKYLGHLIRGTYSRFDQWRLYSNSRKEAIAILKEVTSRKDKAIIDKKLLSTIKNYSNKMFGSIDYWPWLALYTEIRGQFIEGWVPDDYYKFLLADKLNLPEVPRLSTLKSFDHRLFKEFSIQPLLIRINGIYFNHEHKLLKEIEAVGVLQNYGGEVVIKRDSGPSGRGLIFKQAEDVRFDGDLSGLHNYVIQPVIKQHKEINKVYSHSVNTIRIVTLLKPDHNIDVMLAIMRFGTNGSRIDNVMSGGRFIAFDSAGNAKNISYDQFGLPAGNKHPDSDYEFSTLKIPGYKEAVEKCVNAHKQYPYNRLIAWDVCIDTTETPKLIEWNSVPGLWRYESVFGPLWPREVLDYV